MYRFKRFLYRSDRPVLSVLCVALLYPVVMMFVLGALCSLLSAFLPYDIVFPTGTALFKGLPVWFNILKTLLLMPVIEELFFRFLLYDYVLKRIFGLPVKYAAPVSALIFGLCHRNIYQGLFCFIAGLYLAFLYDRRQSPALPILFHVTSNSSALLFELFLAGIMR